jgi:hypothetical protein
MSSTTPWSAMSPDGNSGFCTTTFAKGVRGRITAVSSDTSSSWLCGLRVSSILNTTSSVGSSVRRGLIPRR